MFAGFLNPWLLLAAFITVVGAFGSGYIKGRSDKEAQQASQELLIQQAAQEAQKATAEVIAQIKIKNTVINKEIQRETRTVPVYSECVHSPDGLRLVNAALLGAKSSSDIKLPRIVGESAR